MTAQPNKPPAQTLGELKKSGYQYRTIQQEIIGNLTDRLAKGETWAELFPGIYGYEDTVLPSLVNALLAGHNIALLGEKGQAKSRLIRALTNFLDPFIPVLAGTEIPEDPLQPVTGRARKILAEKGDGAPLNWLPAAERYRERLAPGTKISDLIGDLDPAKIVDGAPLASEDAIHFGLIPRSNRCIFAINELPDLDYLVQVGLFNILEESDVQIRGYPLRFPLDVFVAFTANPDDYARSGKIITQLKDRIGSEIRTHYPKYREEGIAITRQEARHLGFEPSHPDLATGETIIPEFMEKIIEEFSRQCRVSPWVNQKSGVSARLSIANIEVAAANARRRALAHKELPLVRPTDLGNIHASTSGKIELDPYRDDSINQEQVIANTLEKAIKIVFLEEFPDLNTKGAAWLRTQPGEGDEEAGPDLTVPYAMAEVCRQVLESKHVEISDGRPAASYQEILDEVPALFDGLSARGWDKSPELRAAGVEFILEGLTSLKKLSRRQMGEAVHFRSLDRF